MGKGTAITDRDTEARVTGYGDRVVAQGDTAAREPAGVTPAATTGGTSSASAAAIAKITIYDPIKLLKGSVLATIVARLEKEMNSTHPPAKPVDYLFKQTGVKFEVKHLPRMSDRNERFIMNPLDFPVYLLNAHSNASTSAGEIRELMLDHGIIDSRGSRHQFEDAEKGWGDKAVEGIGIQPLQGFRKVAFVKGDLVSKLAKDFESAVTNVIKHEVGHTLNIPNHDNGGVMIKSVHMSSGFLDFSAADFGRIVQTLVTLTTKAPGLLQKAYERANL